MRRSYNYKYLKSTITLLVVPFLPMADWRRSLTRWPWNLARLTHMPSVEYATCDRSPPSPAKIVSSRELLK